MRILTRLNKVVAYSDQTYIPIGNSALCAITGECYDNVLITKVDYVPTDIDKYEYYYIDGQFIKGSSRYASEFGKVLWQGSASQLHTLTVKGISKYTLIALHFHRESDSLRGSVVVCPVYHSDSTLSSYDYMFHDRCHLASARDGVDPVDTSFCIQYSMSDERLRMYKLDTGIKLVSVVGIC